MKIVVFDLDETLGYFTQFGIFWDCLKQFLSANKNYKLSQKDFNELLDLYPEFIRPNILPILQYLKHKKKSKCCHKLMIYTNNNGSKEWSNHIKYYFEHKIKYNLIDQIIAAFKVNGQQIEMCRTTHDKTHKDFIRCTKLPLHSEICFLDDTFHPGMANDNIYYINLKPYYYDLEFDYMIKVFQESKIGETLLKGKNESNNEPFEEFMKQNIRKYNYKYVEKTEEEYEIDKILGKYILTHLKTFFNDKQYVKTRKNMNVKNIIPKKNKTRRNI